MRNNRMLVTGGAGFIGSHLCDLLLQKGLKVTVLDNLSTGRSENVSMFEGNSNYEFVEGDIRNREVLEKQVHRADAVFHLAAMVSVPLSLEKPDECYEVNVKSFNELLLAARGRKTPVIYASSAAIYGEGVDEGPRAEEENPDPLSPYGASKAIDELLALTATNAWDVPTVGMRFFNVYGPRQVPDGAYASVIPRFSTAILSGKPATIYGDGSQTRDFIYAGDIARTLAEAARKSSSLSGTVVNVGSGRRSSVNDVYRIITGMHEPCVEPVFMDERPGDIKHSYAKLGRLSAFMDLSTFTSLEKGIEYTVSYYSKEKELSSVVR